MFLFISFTSAESKHASRRLVTRTDERETCYLLDKWMQLGAE